MSTPNSTWISRILYARGFLAIVRSHGDALLYGPSEQNPTGVPPWIPGLLCAGTGRRSPGLAYNRLVKGRYQYQRVQGEQKVQELVSMMTGLEQLSLSL